MISAVAELDAARRALRTAEIGAARGSSPAARGVLTTLLSSIDSASAYLEAFAMNSLQQRVPGLRRHDARTSTIRQHYYPEGGWGWVVCGCAFLVHLLLTGLQLSYGVLLLLVLTVWGRESYLQAVWLGSLNLCVSLLVSPAVVGLCRRKSTRLTAVLGGLVVALACLFTSFATELHQLFLR
ncbi:monocarboxylate transporter 14-like [Pollicipes pollicipes]|uniref:monocarboxylate transporter 14-like n=1 Tax=Pollicipes pollicipes TaxID=41117 RepID=UPI001884BC0B|nr:monocarboxylate transporter 14-like [Pollicipes pollicipes]